MNKEHGLLIVDDELANLQKLKRTFLEEFEVYEATGGEEAIELLKQKSISIIVTDQRMPGMSGVELLLRSLEINPDVIRIILTGYTEVEDLMDAINQGHVHRYITKPWEPFSLRAQVKRELERWELKRENQRLAEELKEANDRLSRENYLLRQEMEVLKESDGKLVYQSKAVEELLRLLSRVVKTDSTILIQGETGTGKELVARFIHEQSQRADEAFVPVNCGAIPDDLVESSFFGHRKGAFTGASESRKGFFELADGGTLFLDEVGEAPVSLQVKLLRVLQEGEILPVGEGTARKVNVRIVASTNRDLSRMVEKGDFRQDLFFRLNVFSVHVPPLRARKEDIPVLVDFFLQRFSRRLNKQVEGVQQEVLDNLLRYDWPGNVRELENEIERLVILCDGGNRITSDLISERIRYPSQAPVDHKRSLKEQLAELEKKLILDALEAHNQNKSHAAEALGITRQTIISKLKLYQS